MFCSVYSIATAQLENSVTLSDVFSNADILRENNMFDSILKGLSIQPSQRFDNAFTNSVSYITVNVFRDDQAVPELLKVPRDLPRSYGIFWPSAKLSKVNAKLG